jgi:LCP family protein required for cell wall assembly
MDRIKRRKKRRRKHILLSILFTILFLVVGSLGYGAYLTYKLASTTNDAHDPLARGEKSDLRVQPIDPDKDNISILFIGIDERQNKKDSSSRSDALVLSTFNKEKNSVKLTSIPRDSRVDIIDPTGENDYGLDKITHAHAFGDAQGDHGVDYAVATVENLFGVPVDYYVKLNFDAFIRIVNKLDGITVDVPVKLVTQDSQGNDGAIVLEPGKQTLNGEEALAFVRNRKSSGSGGDLGRGQRQMDVIKAVIEKSTSISSITKYDDMIEVLKGSLSTNLTLGNVAALKGYAGSINDIETLQLKGYDDRISEIYYYIPDEESLEHISGTLQEHLGLSNNE